MPSKNGLGILGGSNGIETSEPEGSLGSSMRPSLGSYDSESNGPDKETAPGSDRAADLPGVDGDSFDTGDFTDPVVGEGIADQAETDVESIIAEYGLAITNGEREYVCELNLDFEDTGLISNFDFDWRQIREEDYDEETDMIRANQQTLAQNAYDNIINADYETGITPLRLQYFTENEENNYFFSWEHGNATRPAFTMAGVSDTIIYGGAGMGDAFFISYESDELSMLSDKFSKDDFATSVENTIQTIANNVYNRLNIVTNLNLEFNKNKTKEIKFKKLSRFEAQQTQDEQTETTGGTRSSLGSGTSGTTGGAY